jgi:hypothetical protein
MGLSMQPVGSEPLSDHCDDCKRITAWIPELAKAIAAELKAEGK